MPSRWGRWVFSPTTNELRLAGDRDHRAVDLDHLKSPEATLARIFEVQRWAAPDDLYDLVSALRAVINPQDMVSEPNGNHDSHASPRERGPRPGPARRTVAAAEFILSRAVEGDDPVVIGWAQHILTLAHEGEARR
jgi:hypothetical protein